jgi:hypothetical protein
MKIVYVIGILFFYFNNSCMEKELLIGKLGGNKRTNTEDSSAEHTFTFMDLVYDQSWGPTPGSTPRGDDYSDEDEGKETFCSESDVKKTGKKVCAHEKEKDKTEAVPFWWCWCYLRCCLGGKSIHGYEPIIE